MAKPPARGAGPTLAEVVVRSGLLARISATTRSVIARSVAQADDQGRVQLKVVSCHACTAPKACCTLTTAAFLYEALPIAARLIAEGRDTPALRAELRVTAEAMENTPRTRYRRACIFLDGAERCTIYEDRPSACGTALVYSPATACSDPRATAIDSFAAPLQREVPRQIEERVRIELGLPGDGNVYMGVLPRVVLLCLQAWQRPDFARFFGQHGPPATTSLARAIGIEG